MLQDVAEDSSDLNEETEGKASGGRSGNDILPFSIPIHFAWRTFTMRDRFMISVAGLLTALGMSLLYAAEKGQSNAAQSTPPRDNAFVNVLWLVQAFGKAEATAPAHDQQLKDEIAAALRHKKSLTATTSEGFMAPETFARLAGDDGELDPDEIRKHLEGAAPATRTALLPAVATHARLLTTGFDQIDEAHRAGGKELAHWIAEKYEPGRPLAITFVCTGNSRRSILGATLGNIAAAYYGLPDIRCYSGGTQPSAFNERTAATLRDIGVEIKATGKNAEGSPDASPNPLYRVRWGAPVGETLLETTEFSKRYDDSHNPQQGFAAILVCHEAEAACPNVKGAAVRIALPYLDPKLYDDTEFEARKYAERRDDIGRLMLAIMMQARRQLVSSGKL